MAAGGLLPFAVFVTAILWFPPLMAMDNGISISEPPPVYNMPHFASSTHSSKATDTGPLSVTGEEDDRPSPNTIVLQGLNKVTGHISRIEAPIGTVMRFGNLEIIGRRCWQSRPDEQPENAGLLEIWELKPGESHQRIFLGWIFSSSPGLSGLEHPVYDVTMLGCETLSDPEQLYDMGSHDEKARPDTTKAPPEKSTGKPTATGAKPKKSAP